MVERSVVRKTRRIGFVLILVYVIVLLVSKPLQAQASKEGHVGVPLDWSTRHVLFTNGASPEAAAVAMRDPRSWINWSQRSSYLSQRYRARGPNERPRPVQLGRQARIDWAVSLGPTGGMPIGESPAKYG